jgi:PAS domain S-box-containing protein
LKKLNYEVVGVVDNGNDAIRLANELKPDLILMDVQIKGDMDGVATASIIRETLDVPVIFLTAFADESTLSRATSAQPYGYLIKPYEETELHTAIEVVLRKHQAIIDKQNISKQALSQSEEALRDSEIRLDLALEAAQTGAWDYVLDKIKQKWTDRCKEIHGLSLDADVTYSVFLAQISEPERARVDQILQNAIRGKEGGNVDIEYQTIPLGDGRSHWVSMKGRVLFDSQGHAFRMLGTARDVSELKKAMVDLYQAKEDAEAANQAKTAFLANMSHEIRTPLGAVVGFSDLLTSQSLSPGDRADYVSIIRKNGEFLANIINDILDLSKIEVGKFEVELHEVKLAEILSDIKILLTLQAQDKGLDLTIETEGPIPKIIRTDALRLRQILLNIIGNAVKFTRAGGIEIKIKRIEDESRKALLKFSIRDSGPGIAPDKINKLFQPFVQADVSTTRKFGGAGLGLILSRRLANALGGDVVLVESVLRKGSLFEVTIDPGPLHGCLLLDKGELGKVVVNSKVPTVTRLDHLRVLLVDDSKDNQFLVTRILGHSGAIIDTAEDGKSAIEMARQNKYDVILMDLQMPLMDGFEATSILRREGYQTPIIALTAHAMREEKQRTLQSGFNGHITKPIDRRALFEELSHYIH